MSHISLRERFARLQAEREQTWKPEQLAGNARQRQALVASHEPAAHPQPDTVIAPFALIDQDGRDLTRDTLTAAGPAVLVFFRFGGCPACNIALPYYNETLWPSLRAAGIPLVAVSAQTPVDRGIINRHGLTFTVATDPNYALSRQLGITFLPEDRPQVEPGEDWIGKTLGTDSYEMTQPAVLILDRGGEVRWLDISPDWLSRTESNEVLDHLPEVARKAAA
ncbi:peroxiredoxin-like family protein [uncultured Novosphingobium sp.]|uniref:peroxiredoxin-like family protein n=1 Tax=uncultured Novosphingobium sp. TaxID=292277 RepID=UPI0037486AEA